MAEMSCVLHVLFWCQIREGTFAGLWLATNKDTYPVKAQDGNSKDLYPQIYGNCPVGPVI